MSRLTVDDAVGILLDEDRGVHGGFALQTLLEHVAVHVVRLLLGGETCSGAGLGLGVGLGVG